MALTIAIFTGFENGDDYELTSTSGTWALVTGGSQRSGDYALRLENTTPATNRAYIRPHNPTTGKLNSSIPELLGGNEPLYVGFYVYFESFPASTNTPFFSIRNTGITVELELRITTTGRVAVYDANGSVVATGATVIPLNTWTRIDIRVDKTQTSGDGYELRINGVTELSADDGEDFDSGQTAVFMFGRLSDPNSNSVIARYDDFAAGVGGWMPYPMAVEATAPHADSVRYPGANFTPSEDKYLNLDDIPADGDTSTVSQSSNFSGSWGVRFESPVSSAVVDTIWAIRPTIVLKDADAGSSPDVILRTEDQSGNKIYWCDPADGCSPLTTYFGFGVVSNYQLAAEFSTQRWTNESLRDIETVVYVETSHDGLVVTQALLHVLYGSIPENGPIRLSTIHGNIAFNNSGDGIGFDTPGSSNEVTKVMVASNSVFDDNDGSQVIGIELGSKCEDCAVVGNTSASTKNQISDSGTNNDISHNIESN